MTLLKDLNADRRETDRENGIVPQQANPSTPLQQPTDPELEATTGYYLILDYSVYKYLLSRIQVVHLPIDKVEQTHKNYQNLHSCPKAALSTP